MARSVQPSSWEHGFRQPSESFSWQQHLAAREQNGLTPRIGVDADDEYSIPPSVEQLTSAVHNDLGLNYLRTWPTIYNGTLSPHGHPSWWNPEKEVDVLIVGAGPAGLQVAVSLARQGVSFRIIDKAEEPLIAGRADGVQPRFLELLHSWGLATEVHEEGPLIERTAIYKDGKRIFFNSTHQSDSRYRGLHIITQGQIERIYVRDLLRHKRLVERATRVDDFNIGDTSQESHPVHATLKNDLTGAKEDIKAKYIVGTDGAGSFVRKKMNIPFDGVTTDIFWGILDCRFESDYPHAWVFGSVISSKHGGCVIIPREDGYIRLYTQLDVTSTGPIAKSRQGQSNDFNIEGGRVDVHSVTAEEVLEQANRIFAPYKLKFASPLSWFAVWKISERVARSFVAGDNRVFLAGDAAHIHSVMGAFGLNASMSDSANLAWKLGLCARGLADNNVLGQSYDSERRLHANRIIRVSGNYLRFVCQSDLPIASFEHNARPEWPELEPTVPYTPGDDIEFLRAFFGKNANFLLGIDADYSPSAINMPVAGTAAKAIEPLNGVRAPNPRVAMSTQRTGYLYDLMTGASMVHIVLFGSNLQRNIRQRLASLMNAISSPGKQHWFHRFGGQARFNVVLVTKQVPHELDDMVDTRSHIEEASVLRDLVKIATVAYDDRAPDEDAHTTYGVHHDEGAVVVVRPDLYVGSSFPLAQHEKLDEYLGGWLLPVSVPSKPSVARFE